MDISKPPLTLDTKPANTSDNKPSQLVISNIQDLNLKEGKQYPAKVISEHIQTNNLPQKTILTDSTEWLVLLKGKTIVISSEKALENGQKLLLKLDPSSTPEKPSLIAQLVNAKPLSGKPIANDSTNALNNLNTSTLLAQASTLDKASIKPLLQAINATLDKQAPLQKSFDQLSSALSNTLLNTQTDAALKNPALDPKMASVIQQDIFNKLPKLSELLQSTPSALSTTQGSGRYVQQSVQHSGLFFEQTLTNKPVLLDTLKQHLNHHSQQLNPPHSLQNQLSQPGHSPREKIQQTIEALLQLASPSRTKSSAADVISDKAIAGIADTSAFTKDLKAILMSVSASLTKQLANDHSDADIKSLFLSQSLLTTDASPFAFPMLNASRSSPSKALFDTPELTTGQLLKLLASMIHKLQFNQLNSLMQSNSSPESALQQTWFFELPILNPNQTVQTFNARLDKEHKDTNNNQDENENRLQWKLLLSFDLGVLGPIYVQITLSEQTITPVLWADKQSTLALLQQESSHFRDQLENIGLNVNDILCQQGQPSAKQATLDRHLVDTKA